MTSRPSRPRATHPGSRLNRAATYRPMPSVRADRLPAFAAASLVAGCSGNPSALDPAGPSAGSIADLFWFFLVVCTVVYVLTIGALAWAVLRSRRRRRQG